MGWASVAGRFGVLLMLVGVALALSAYYVVVSVATLAFDALLESDDD